MRHEAFAYVSRARLPSPPLLRDALAKVKGLEVVELPTFPADRASIRAAVDGTPIEIGASTKPVDAAVRLLRESQRKAEGLARDELDAALDASDVKLVIDCDDSSPAAVTAAHAIARTLAELAGGWFGSSRHAQLQRLGAAPSAGRAFDLTGSDGDETRLLRCADIGYSIALAGRPRIVAAPEGAMTYDVVVALDDIRVTHGWRVDDLPPGQEPRALAMAMVTGYRNRRAKDQTAQVKPLPWTVPGTAGGAQCVYPRRDVERPTIEHAWIMVQQHAGGARAVIHSTWFANDDVNGLQWAHLRASFIDQHAWDGKPRDATPQIWPPSEITVPSAMLGLTPAAWARADELANEVGHLTKEQMLGIAAILLEYSQSNLSPRAPAPELVHDNIRRSLRQHGPAPAVEACLATLDRCQTRHDLRGWAWMCTWALGSRAELRAAP